MTEENKPMLTVYMSYHTLQIPYLKRPKWAIRVLSGQFWLQISFSLGLNYSFCSYMESSSSGVGGFVGFRGG